MEKLKKAIQSKKIAPIYFFTGSESYLKEEFATLIQGALFASEEDAVANTHLLHGHDMTLRELLSRASEYPMFTERQLLVVRHFEKIKKPTTKEQQKQQYAAFGNYLANPATFTVLLLDADELDKSDFEKQPFSLLKSVRHDFPAIKHPDLFASERAAQAGWEFEPDALKAFAAYIDPSSREICQELDKIILYASERQSAKRITAADVLDCVGVSRTYNVFELEKALVARNLRLCSGMSLMIMDQEGQKEGLMAIVRYLTTFYMRLWKISMPEVQRMAQSDIAKVLGMSPRQEFLIKSYLTYTRQFSLQQTEAALCALRDVDASLKGLRPYSDEKYLLLQLMQRLLG
uniref:DNA polymerase III, delta subunit n=1 Tax=Chlorobium chlorochromatii (strain CaD3) TaxID=340177 RepID=Q3AU23_CHLCH